MEDSLQILYNCIYFLFLQAVLSSVHDLTKLWKSRILNSSKCTFQEALMQLSTPVILYLLLINLIAFALMGVDKSRARRHKWRIPEKTLFLSVLLGGSVGAIAGMQFFRHKTKHWYFVIGMPAILVLQAAGYFFLSHRPFHRTRCFFIGLNYSLYSLNTSNALIANSFTA